MATRKLKYDDTQNNDNSFFNTMLGNKTEHEETAPRETKRPAITNNLEEDPTEEKKLFTMKINASLLKEWKQFCLNNEIPLSMAIRKSMKLLIKGVENGTIEL